MTCIVDILSALVWVICTAAPWLLAFFAVSAAAHALRSNKPSPFPRLWQVISGTTGTGAKGGGKAIWRALEHGLGTLPGACIPQMALGILLAAGIMLTVPWDYTFYQERPVIETLEFIMLVSLAVLLRLPLCASLPGALALLAKEFSPGLALLYLLLFPASKLAFGEREAGVSRFACMRKAVPRLLLLDVPLVLLYLLLCCLFPSVRHAGRQGPPTLSITVAEQICGSIYCAILLRLAILRLFTRKEANASQLEE